jgi:hypothetical protein
MIEDSNANLKQDIDLSKEIYTQHSDLIKSLSDNTVKLTEFNLYKRVQENVNSILTQTISILRYPIVRNILHRK